MCLEHEETVMTCVICPSDRNSNTCCGYPTRLKRLGSGNNFPLCHTVEIPVRHACLTNHKTVPDSKRSHQRTLFLA